MYCIFCGKELADGAVFCSYCGSKVNNKPDKTPSSDDIETNNTVPSSANSTEEQADVPNANSNIIGKTYYFESGTGLCFPNFQRIKTAVSLQNDRLTIEKNPARLNDMPVIMLDQLTSITIGRKLVFDHIGFAVLSLIGAFAFPPVALLSILFVYWAINTKITLFTKSGTSTIIYTKKRNDAILFYDEINSMVHFATVSAEGKQFIYNYYSSPPSKK